ncbi:alpha/beta hydrolase [Tritonibacter mobilis]|nr:alpha/beta hydrolase [Tritonibacter mobilis]
MAVIRINAVGDTPVVHARPGPLEEEIARLGPLEGPVIVMIHGYSYKPGLPAHCPHRHILSLDPHHMPWLAPSWPRQLGFGMGRGDEGLAVAFGWNSRGSLAAAQARAIDAGRALARLVEVLHRQAPACPIHLIGHSLGSEVVLRALKDLPVGAVQRVISLSGASYQSLATSALTTPAGRAVEFFNITSRENDTFDFLFETLTRRPNRNDRAISKGISAPNAVTLQIDCLETLEQLSRMGHPLGLPERRVCHRSTYLRPGALRLYRQLMRHPEQMPLARIQSSVPTAPEPRWSRLLRLRPQPGAVPIWQRIELG